MQKGVGKLRVSIVTKVMERRVGDYCGNDKSLEYYYVNSNSKMIECVIVDHSVLFLDVNQVLNSHERESLVEKLSVCRHGLSVLGSLRLVNLNIPADTDETWTLRKLIKAITFSCCPLATSPAMGRDWSGQGFVLHHIANYEVWVSTAFSDYFFEKSN